MEPENPGLEMAKSAAEGAGRESVSTLANAIHDMFPFWGLKRKAVDTYVDEIKRSSLSPDAKLLAISSVKKTYRELKNQTAVVDIAYSAINSSQGADFLPASDGDTELIDRIIDAVKFVSDVDLQLLWGNVLAGELETPGSTPKNAVRILSELSKKLAVAFSNICSLRVDILLETGIDGLGIQSVGYDLMLCENFQNKYLSSMDITPNTLQELEEIGLIHRTPGAPKSGNIDGFYDPSSAFPRVHIINGDDVITASNIGDLSWEQTNFLYPITLPLYFPIKRFTFTTVGKCIARFSPKRYNPDLTTGIKEFLRNQVFTVHSTPGIRITGATEKGLETEYTYEILS